MLFQNRVWTSSKVPLPRVSSFIIVNVYEFIIFCVLNLCASLLAGVQLCWLGLGLGPLAHTIRVRVPRALETLILTQANIIARRLGEKRKD